MTSTVTWETATDWDGAQSEDGVVHESVANTDHNDATNLKMGYSVENPYLSADLRGYWPMHEDSDGVAYDFSGNNNDGTVNGATQGVTGILGGTAYDFSSDSVDVLPNFDNKTIYGVSAWVNPDTVQQQVVYSERNTNIDDIRFHLQLLNDNTIRAGCRKGTGSFYGATGGAYSTNTWHHVAGFRIDTNLYVYLDGKQVGSSDAPSGTIPQDQDAYIGKATTSGTSDVYLPFDGSICEVRAYDYALTESEVQYLYDVVANPSSLTTARKVA